MIYISYIQGYYYARTDLIVTRAVSAIAELFVKRQTNTII